MFIAMNITKRNVQARETLKRYLEMTRELTRESTERELQIIEGEIPSDLEGTLFRAGPGRMHNHGHLYDHLFDGDGVIQKIAFSRGAATYTSRFVRTKYFTAEENAGRSLYRSFGSNLPGGALANFARMKFKNAANTNVLLHPDGLLALWEGGSPHLLDPLTLETRGEWRADGILSEKNPVEKMMSNGRAFSAHYKIDPATGVMHNFGMSPGLDQRMLMYRMEHDGPLEIREVKLPRLTFIHDFSITDKGERIFFDVPVHFALLRTFLGQVPPAASIRENPKGNTYIRIFDRENHQRIVETDPCYIFHFGNAWHGDDDCIRVQVCRMDRFPSSAQMSALLKGEVPQQGFHAYLYECAIDLKRNTVSWEKISDHPMELPSFNLRFTGIPNSYLWSSAARPDRSNDALLHGIAKYDIAERETIFADRYPRYTGEPLFIPRPGADREDDGYLACLFVDMEDDYAGLEILQAADLRSLALLKLPLPINVGFHGLWTDRRF